MAMVAATKAECVTTPRQCPRHLVPSYNCWSRGITRSQPRRCHGGRGSSGTSSGGASFLPFAAATPSPSPLPLEQQQKQQQQSRPRLTTRVHTDADGFQPRLLTHELRRARDLEALQQLWARHADSFNAFHYSALMQQLAALHCAAEVAAVAVRPAAQPSRQPGQQGRRARVSDAGAQPASLPAVHQTSSEEQIAALDYDTAMQLLGALPGSPSQMPARSDDEHSHAVDCSSSGSGGDAPAASQQQQQQQEEQGQLQQEDQQPGSRQTRTSSPPVEDIQSVLTPPTPPALPGSRQLQRPLAPRSGHAEGVMRSRGREAQDLARAVATRALTAPALDSLDGRGRVMLCYALAKLGVRDAPLLRLAVAALDGPTLAELDEQQLSNLLWAVGALAGGGGGVYTATAGEGGAGAAGRSSTPGAAAADASWLTMQSGSSQSRMAAVVPDAWLAAAAAALQTRLPSCSTGGLAMALWGLGQLGYTPCESWWAAYWTDTEPRLGSFSGHELALLAHAAGRLRVKPPESWLRHYLSASCDALPSMSPQELTMSLWGLAAAGAVPHKAWLMLWFLVSRASMPRAGARDLSLWVYSLALLKVTPSPVWCSSYVEASYGPLTRHDARPQELVNVMWAVSCMRWSPPLLYWKGLLEAARSSFGRFNPQDLANCVSAATAVDVGSLNPRWLKDFAAASLPKLPAFQPVQLAHTVNALALAADSAQGGRHAVHAAWLSAFSQAAAAHLAAGRLRGRNLRMSVEGLQRLKFSPTPRPVAAFLARASAVIADEEEAITHSAGAGAGGSSSSEASSAAAAVW